MGTNGPDAVDRQDAGRRLAFDLRAFAGEDPIVLALGWGAVPIAFEVARTLDAPLDILWVQEISAPNDPELVIGAIVDGRHAHAVWNRDMLACVRLSPQYLRRERERRIAELNRLRAAYRGGRPGLDPGGRTAILVADRMTTGGRARFALEALRESGARRRVLAVPIGARGAMTVPSGEADEVVCLDIEETADESGSHDVAFDEMMKKDAMTLIASMLKSEGHAA